MKPIHVPPIAVRQLDPDRAADQCQWFLLCENRATVTITHPVYGDVPSCICCQAKVRELEDG